MAVAVALAWASSRVYGEKYRARALETALAQSKLSAVARRQEIDDLTQASVLLKDEERQRIDAIREDVAVLSRRNLALMQELDVRLTRLERRMENERMIGQLAQVREKERSLLAVGSEK